MVASGLVISLYLGVIALLFALAALRFWFILISLRRQIPKPINVLEENKPAFIVGHLITSQQNLIKSPYSDVLCAGFVANVEQKTTHFDPKKGFLDSEWTFIGTSARTAPFLIKDATGIICVMTSHAQLTLSRTLSGELDVKHVFHPVKKGMRWLKKRLAPIQSIWVSECLLCEGDAVFVSGIAQLATSLDRQNVPVQFQPLVKYVIKGSDVIVSTTVPASHIPFYEKCLRFCALSCGACVVLILALVLVF